MPRTRRDPLPPEDPGDEAGGEPLVDPPAEPGDRAAILQSLRRVDLRMAALRDEAERLRRALNRLEGADGDEPPPGPAPRPH